MIVGGADARAFDPGAPAARKTLAAALWRLAGSPAAENAQPFTDVAGGAWYAGAVAWAAENGIADGYGTGAFGPGDRVTRAQTAALLARVIAYTGVTRGEGLGPASFADGGGIPAYAKEAAGRLGALGVMTGRPGGVFDPAADVTNAEVAALMHRFTVLLAGVGEL
jgi:hypothetical protein